MVSLGSQDATVEYLLCIVSWAAVCPGKVVRGDQVHTETNVAGRKIMVRMVMAFIELRSRDIFRFMSILIAQSCCVTALKTWRIKDRCHVSPWYEDNNVFARV